MRYVELTFAPPLEGRIQSLSRALGSAGVAAASFHGPFGRYADHSSYTYDIGNFDAEGRKEALREHESYLQHCASLGAKLYVIHAGLENYGFSRGGRWDDVTMTGTLPREESTIGRLWETNASSLAELGDFASDLGVKIALETGLSSMTTPAETMRMVQMANSDNVGVCVDTGHINVGGKIKPSDAIREAGQLVWALHLQDNKGDGDFHLAPGKGSIDWVAVAKALEDVYYSGKLTLEVGAA